MSRYADEITCPWCGYEYSDSWEVGQDQEDIGLLECEKCGKEFYATRNVSVTYSTVKATYGTCKACGERDVAIENLSSSVGSYEGLCRKCGVAAYKKFIDEYFDELAGGGKKPVKPVPLSELLKPILETLSDEDLKELDDDLKAHQKKLEGI